MEKEKGTGHRIESVLPGSIAVELEIEAGDRLLAINGEEIEDIFDYQYLTVSESLELLIEKQNGEQWLLEVDKEEDEDLGLVFTNGLMDEYRSCRNQCIFCFIDQMPPGMRKTLYFKDDDERLSFLQGNYVTLTNLSERDMERIIRYRLSPINISFQTMNPKLRCKMLHNRFAGEALKKADRLYQAGITMNGQIVLCKGINDGAELEFSIRELMKYLPVLESVSVVPVGLTKYRDGLYPLKPFEKQDAAEVLALLQGFREECYQQYGTHFVHASDEWYLLAEQKLPEAEAYDGYPQLENGVGMLRLFLDEFQEALEGVKVHIRDRKKPPERQQTVSLATGALAYPYLKQMALELMEKAPGLSIHVYEIINEFFGERITVSGLLTGGDILRQLQGKELGERLLLPENMLRSGEDVFLDDLRVTDLEKTLQVKIDIVKSSGYDLVKEILGGSNE